jgi:hypothetical protein
MSKLLTWIAGFALLAGTIAATSAQTLPGDGTRVYDPTRDVEVDQKLPFGMVAWWRLDERGGFLAPDVAGGNDGRLAGFGDPRWVPGQLGRALAFDGRTGNAVVIPSAPLLNPRAQLSISAWIYSHTGGRTQPETILSKEGGGFTQYSLRIESAGLLRFTIGNASLTAPGRIAPDTWTHVVASFDGQVMRVFVDGAADARTLRRPGAMQSTEYPVRLGSGADPRQPLAFNGLLDDVRLYERGLGFVDAASLFREGTDNSTSAFARHAHISQYGDQYKIDNSIAGSIPGLDLGKPWWYYYQQKIEDSGEPPELKWEIACGPVDDTGKLLDCFLKLNPSVRDSIVWQNLNYITQKETDLPYSQWSAARKQDLYQAFFHAFQWMKGGLQTFNGTQLTDPPVNQLNLPDAAPAQTVLAPDAAWKLYVNTIAQSLAVEIGGFVPWSITGYYPWELESLFHSKTMFDAGWGANWETYPNSTPIFGYQPAGYTMEEPPTAFFQFLVDNDMIRGNHLSTIERVVDWSRFHLAHITTWTDASAKAFETWWGYRGTSPASAVLAGTLGPFKGYPPWSVDAPHHSWIYGCHGTVTLYRGMFRTVNIPTEYRMEYGHAMPFWWTVGKSMSHGDDVDDLFYSADTSTFKWDTPSTWAHWFKHAKPSEYLIDFSDFYDWFQGPNADSINVGRVSDVVNYIKYPNDVYLKKYCYDKAHNLSHANGTVFTSFQGGPLVQLFPLPVLEQMGYWTTLDAEATQFGVCP